MTLIYTSENKYLLYQMNNLKKCHILVCTWYIYSDKDVRKSMYSVHIFCIKYVPDFIPFSYSMYLVHTGTYFRTKVCTWYILGAKSMYLVHHDSESDKSVYSGTILRTGMCSVHTGTYYWSGFQMTKAVRLAFAEGRKRRSIAAWGWGCCRSLLSAAWPTPDCDW